MVERLCICTKRAHRRGSSPVAAWQMKPILYIHNGMVDAYTTERTRKKALAKFLEVILAECPKSEDACATIEHGGVLEQAQELAAVLKTELNVKEIPLTFLPPAIMVHGGPGVLGVSFFAAK